MEKNRTSKSKDDFRPFRPTPEQVELMLRLGREAGTEIGVCDDRSLRARGKAWRAEEKRAKEANAEETPVPESQPND